MDAASVVRDIVFISKATPGDDEFVLWLAPRLEEAGYTVFADILNLDPGDRWRKIITSTLQTRAIKMLLCCRDTTLAKDNVQEEIGIALDLARDLPDPKFIIPLRLEAYKKVLGIGELQYIDFVRGWADGLDKLLETLKRQNIPCDPTKIRINPNWEIYRRRGSIPIKNEPERLTSNWLRVAEAPDVVRYFEPSGSADLNAIASVCASAKYPTQPMQRGFVAFGTRDEINEDFATTGKFDVKAEIPLMDFIAKGAPQYGIQGKDASNVVVSMFRQGWNAYCRDKNSS